MKRKIVFSIIVALSLAFAFDIAHSPAQTIETPPPKKTKKVKKKGVVMDAARQEEERVSRMEKVFEVASQYAEAISCETILDSKKLVALVPWDDDQDLLDARYALIWQGDIKCWGGSGSSQPQITLIGFGAGGSVMAFPELSSPIVKFEPSIRIIETIDKATENEITLTGKDWDWDHDGLCCPSVPVQIIMRRDKNNDWKLIQKLKLADRAQRK